MGTAPAIEPLAYDSKSSGPRAAAPKRAAPIEQGRPPQKVNAAPRQASAIQARGASRPVTQQRKTISRSTNQPWWFLIPKVLYGCYKIVLAPFTLLVMISELIMASVVLGIVAIIAGWWTGWIPEAQIVDTARQVGDRLMAMLQSAGYL